MQKTIGLWLSVKSCVICMKIEECFFHVLTQYKVPIHCNILELVLRELPLLNKHAKAKVYTAHTVIKYRFLEVVIRSIIVNKFVTKGKQNLNM